MGRVEQRLYRQQMARRRLGRMIALMLLIFAAGALTITRNAASHLTAETIAQPTATPIAAAYDQTVVSREITLAAETWYAIQTGVFSNEDAAREKAELLTDRGAPGAVVEDGEKWRVFIACYGTETDAASVRQRLGENQRIETYLYRWICPELQLRLKGMAGQVDVAEAGFTLLLQAARTLRDTASLLDAGELTLTEAREQITALDGQLTLWRLPQSESAYYRRSASAYPHAETQVETLPLDGENPQHVGVLNAFAAHILHGTPLVADGAEGIRALMLSNAMHLSSWTGKPVSLPIDEGEFVRLLAEKRLHSRKKQVKEVTFATDHSGTGRAEG